MGNILEALYNQQTKFLESDFEKVVCAVRTHYTARPDHYCSPILNHCPVCSASCLISAALHAITWYLSYFLRMLSTRQLTEQPANDIESFVHQDRAEKFVYEKD